MFTIKKEHGCEVPQKASILNNVRMKTYFLKKFVVPDQLLLIDNQIFFITRKPLTLIALIRDKTSQSNIGSVVFRKMLRSRIS